MARGGTIASDSGWSIRRTRSSGHRRIVVLDDEEMYGEHFDIPQPDELVFVSWFEGGEVSAAAARTARARAVFYFRPGHETFRPTTMSTCAG